MPPRKKLFSIFFCPRKCSFLNHFLVGRKQRNSLFAILSHFQSYIPFLSIFGPENSVFKSFLGWQKMGKFFSALVSLLQQYHKRTLFGLRKTPFSCCMYKVFSQSITMGGIKKVNNFGSLLGQGQQKKHLCIHNFDKSLLSSFYCLN